MSAVTDRGVKVRFCPSPTGTPHVGLIRTALYNWAFARRHGGSVVFRIEDTDAARDSQDSYDQLLDALRWLGLTWDEGVEVGGPAGPYRQSERGAIYAEVMAKLVAAGHVYEAYSTAAEVEQRHVAAGRDPKLGYDNFDRDLTAEQVAQFQAEGRQPVLRLRMPDQDWTFTDLVRGEVSFPAGTVPDFVVARADGSPLYTFVNPVDDALMGVTHVLRGEDLLSSTPRQLALYAALIDVGVTDQTPEFGHMPLVTGEGNKKLSKRDPQSNLFHHRDRGFVPEGLLNYLALLGWSIAPDRDIFTFDEMAAAFAAGDISKTAARFDLAKAEAINGDHLRMLAVEDFTERMVPYLQAAQLLGEQPTEAQLQTLALVAPHVQTRMKLLGEVPLMLGFLFVSPQDFEIDPAARKTLKAGAHEVLAAALEALQDPSLAWTTQSLEEALRAVLIDKLELKPRLAFGPLRVAISGQRISPPLFESMEILGREQSMVRLTQLAAELEPNKE